MSVIRDRAASEHSDQRPVYRLYGRQIHGHTCTEAALVGLYSRGPCIFAPEYVPNNIIYDDVSLMCFLGKPPVLLRIIMHPR